MSIGLFADNAHIQVCRVKIVHDVWAVVWRRPVAAPVVAVKCIFYCFVRLVDSQVVSSNVSQVASSKKTGRRELIDALTNEAIDLSGSQILRVAMKHLFQLVSCGTRVKLKRTTRRGNAIQSK